MELGFRVHPHIHYVVPAGGLSPDGERWIHCPPRFLLPVKILSEVFRGKLVGFLEQAWRQRKLELDGPLEPLRHPVLFEDLMDQLYRHDWVVYAKEPFAEPEKVLQYLARYTHRGAISNDRLLAIDDDKVVFRYKAYAQGGVWRTMPLEATELIRRWAAAEAMVYGRGGPRVVAQATGLSRTTVKAGIAELTGSATASGAAGTERRRVRRAGGGRRPLTEKDPGLARDLESLVDPETRGDPMSPLRWTTKSALNW